MQAHYIYNSTQAPLLHRLSDFKINVYTWNLTRDSAYLGSRPAGFPVVEIAMMSGLPAMPVGPATRTAYQAQQGFAPAV